MKLNYYKATTDQHFWFISSLFRSPNVKYFLTKKISVRELKELNRSPRRNDYILLANNKNIGWFNIRQSVNPKEGSFGVIIDKSYQGKGYGKQAMEIIEREARRLGIKNMKLEVIETNERAIKLYGGDRL